MKKIKIMDDKERLGKTFLRNSRSHKEIRHFKQNVKGKKQIKILKRKKTKEIVDPWVRQVNYKSVD